MVWAGLAVRDREGGSKEGSDGGEKLWLLMTYSSHVDTTRDASAKEKRRDVSRVIVDALHRNIVRADTGLQCSDEGWTYDAADVAGFEGATGEDQGEGLADAGENIVVVDSKEVCISTAGDGGGDGGRRWAGGAGCDRCCGTGGLSGLKSDDGVRNGCWCSEAVLQEGYEACELLDSHHVCEFT